MKKLLLPILLLISFSVFAETYEKYEIIIKRKDELIDWNKLHEESKATVNRQIENTENMMKYFAKQLKESREVTDPELINPTTLYAWVKGSINETTYALNSTCKIPELLSRGYDFNIMTSIPITKLKSKTDMFFPIPDGAVIEVGCWSPVNQDAILYIKRDHSIKSASINIDSTWKKVKQTRKVREPEEFAPAWDKKWQIVEEKAKNEVSMQAKLAIKQKVNRSWIRPVSATPGLNCSIRVSLMPDGTVINAEVISSSGNENFDRSAEKAVNNASPLPVPEDKELFATEFASHQFLFNPH